jgi:transposase
MHKQTSRRRRSAAEWKELVTTWERSGQSAARFAIARGIRPGTLSWWRWRLSRGAAARGKQGGRHKARRGGEAHPRLVAVEVHANEAGTPGLEQVAWELETCRGVVLRVRGDLSMAQLELVLATMTEPEPAL